MPETTRRVVVTLVAATDEPAHQVMAGVLDAVRNRLPELAIHSTTASAFDRPLPEALMAAPAAVAKLRALLLELDR